jgi:hypothetical protein
MIRISPAFDFNAERRKNGLQTEPIRDDRAGRSSGGWQPTVHHAARMGVQSVSAGTQKTPGAAPGAPP